MEKSTSSRGVIITGTEATEHTACHAQGCVKLSSYDWVADLPKTLQTYDIVEVQFKNTRKGFYRNANLLNLAKGDIIAVEASPGHDIGVVSLTGWLVERQMKRVGYNSQNTEFKKVYRKAKQVDIEKWLEAIALEHETMIKARRIAENLNLNMKIGDVEYQGDKTKAIFYYIADDRVDFRELIKVLAEEFKVRIEMRQIGARQEAGRIGGIGSCGRDLCCSSWISHFDSVSTNAAKVQEISLNPQKLAGQCGKLKCCLNYELDSYIDARKDFPDTQIPLETKEATYFHFKTDIFKRSMWFSSDQGSSVNLVEVSVDRVKEIAELNKKGLKANKLIESSNDNAKSNQPLGFTDGLQEDSLTRFDAKAQNKKKKKRSRFKGNQNTRNA
ncbi:MAG: stage 0 sporulation family protein [Bacteroidales bacterium]